MFFTKVNQCLDWVLVFVTAGQAAGCSRFSCQTSNGFFVAPRADGFWQRNFLWHGLFGIDHTIFLSVNCSKLDTRRFSLFVKKKKLVRTSQGNVRASLLVREGTKYPFVSRGARHLPNLLTLQGFTNQAIRAMQSCHKGY